MTTMEPKHVKPTIPALFLGLILISAVHAQTSTTGAANGSVAVAPSAPNGQAPDEMTRKITELVLAGKYAEAQKLTEGLLIAYPDDQRLIKAKALIDSRLSSGGSTSAAPGNAQPTQPTANPNAEQLTGMDKVDYDALIELGRQAQLTTDLEQQKVSLKQFMDQSAPFLQKHPDQILLWQLRAASAISLNDFVAGYDAGQKLLAAGVADSTDPGSRRLLAQLKNKGWLDKKALADFQEKEHLNRYSFLGERQTFTHSRRGRLTLNENEAVYEGADGIIRISRDDIREIQADGGGGVTFLEKDAKKLVFSPFYQEDIPCCDVNVWVWKKVGAVMDAIVERWRFVLISKPTDAIQTLRPPNP
jgi:hypothetical protein